MCDEIWKTIDNSKYEVSNKGNVRNKITNYVLKPSIDKYGYYKLMYRDNDGIKKYKTVHRLVAENWIPKLSENLQVNHKDGIKINNYFSNLEWVTNKENIKHSYDLFLNKNTNPVELFNKDTNICLYFKSIKELSRYLKIHSSALIPLIKNSSKNPIDKKYIITLVDEEATLNKANTVNFGKTTYVYDLINNEFKSYPSILIASYFTGIRSLNNLVDFNALMYKIGYFISFNKDNIPKINNVDINKIIIERENYINKPYCKQNHIYYLYNYYKQQEIIFNKLEDVKDYLDNSEPKNKICKKSHISSSIIYGVLNNRTGLIKGFGIKTSLNNFNWFEYTEEEILINKYSYSNKTKVYGIFNNDVKDIVFGIYGLCNYFNYKPDKLINNITIDEILKFSNIPNQSIRRLNLPIKLI